MPRGHLQKIISSQATSASLALLQLRKPAPLRDCSFHHPLSSCFLHLRYPSSLLPGARRTSYPTRCPGSRLTRASAKPRSHWSIDRMAAVSAPFVMSAPPSPTDAPTYPPCPMPTTKKPRQLPDGGPAALATLRSSARSFKKQRPSTSLALSPALPSSAPPFLPPIFLVFTIAHWFGHKL